MMMPILPNIFKDVRDLDNPMQRWKALQGMRKQGWLFKGR